MPPFYARRIFSRSEPRLRICQEGFQITNISDFHKILIINLNFETLFHHHNNLYHGHRIDAQIVDERDIEIVRVDQVLVFILSMALYTTQQKCVQPFQITRLTVA